MDQYIEILHAIDKRLAILEALSEQHSELTEAKFNELRTDVKKLVSELSNLKMKVAGLAAGISFLMTAGISWFSR